MNIKYLFGSIISVPLLPFMYVAGKKVRQEVPSLKEAEDKYGSTDSGKENFNLLMIGESTIAGVGVSSHKGGFTGQLATLISDQLNAKVEWEVVAKSGYTAAQTVTKLVPKIKTTNPNLIVIGLGANDAFTLNTPRQWCENIVSLIQLLQGKFDEIPILFLNMPPIKQFPALPPILKHTTGNLVEILGSELEKLVKKFNKVYYISKEISFETWDQKYNLNKKSDVFFSDGIHPSALTYKLWAQETFEFISKAKIIEKESNDVDNN